MQDNYLRNLIDKRTPVTLFLLNGVKLQGLIIEHDAYTLQLHRSNATQLVYKHALATIVPGLGG